MLSQIKSKIKLDLFHIQRVLLRTIMRMKNQLRKEKNHQLREKQRKLSTSLTLTSKP